LPIDFFKRVINAFLYFGRGGEFVLAVLKIFDGIGRAHGLALQGNGLLFFRLAGRERECGNDGNGTTDYRTVKRIGKKRHKGFADYFLKPLLYRKRKVQAV